MNKTTEDINHTFSIEEVSDQISTALSLSICCLIHSKKCALAHTFLLHNLW